MRKFWSGALVIAAAAGSTAAYAHDFFLLPDAFQNASTGALRISATVGSSFPAPDTAVAADRVQSLFVHGAGKPKVRVVGTSGKALSLEVTGTRPGLLVTGVKTLAREVDYEEDRIPLILGEYRVAPQAAAAVERLSKPRTWLVSSRRFAKTLVCIQKCTNRSAAERAFGAELEFVGQGSAGDRFRLLKKGSALANYPIDLVGADGKRQHLSTNAKGDIHLPSAERGTMMLFAAVLTPPTGNERFILDLTSLTFSRS